MKVAIREQIDITDVQRVHLADILDNAQTKRQATREEIKDFAWALGNEWDVALDARWAELFGADETAESGDETAAAPDAEPDAPEADEEEDLLGLTDMSPEEAMEALL